jgi:hypothetical protein
MTPLLNKCHQRLSYNASTRSFSTPVKQIISSLFIISRNYTVDFGERTTLGFVQVGQDVVNFNN